MTRAMPPGNGLDSNHIQLMTPTGDAAIDADLKYIEKLDWSKSSIGPISSWPPELLVLINLAMLSPQPQLFLLGPDSIILYNTAYGRLLYDHHPEYQGRPIGLNTALIANAKNIDRIVDRASNKSKPANENWVPFFFLNHGVLQEVFLSATMVKLPISLGGFHATTYDTTPEAVKARRDSAYDDIFTAASSATHLKELWRLLLEGVAASVDEVPFALLYSARMEVVQDVQTDTMHRKVNPDVFDLEGVVGDFPILPPNELHLSAAEGWLTSIKHAVHTRTPTLLRTEDGTLPDSFTEASHKRCYGDLCLAAVVLPSTLKGQADVHALLILGLAPRRPYDEVYQAWMRMCNRTYENLVATINIAEASTFAKESERRRAARETDMLAKELKLKNHEAALATDRVQRMLRIMESAGVGVFESLPSGVVIQANHAFGELSGSNNELDLGLSINIFDLCDPQDSSILSTHWNALLAAQSVTFTIRFRDSPESSQWVQATCMPVLDNQARVTTITGCVTDVSAQKGVEQEAIKRAEALEKLRLSEARLLKFIETAPLGILILNDDKRPSFVNQTWFQLTQHSNKPVEEIDIYSVILHEDIDVFDSKLDELLSSSKPVEFQMRLRCFWSAPVNGSSEHAWVQLTAFPDIVDGRIQQIMVAVTDINHFKYAESIHRARLNEAIEAKRQQENFVDMTSHEIRNPLGAVIHRTDAICQNLADMNTLIQRIRTAEELPMEFENNIVRLSELHQDTTESVETIVACNTHQKRIVDDILSLSKLDSNLLEISPSTFNISSFLNQVRSTFTAEAESAGVTLKTECDRSIAALDIQWIKADPGRIMQVLVNLVSNAIKFTKDATTNRLVTVSMGTSKTRSIGVFSDLIIARNPDFKTSVATKTSTDSFFLWFCVRDTGCGLDAAGRAKLFSRFSQASPKTYNKYGGSGLGLFISQKLTALQDGEIGFISEIDNGSKFAFYVQALKAAPPVQDNIPGIMNNMHKDSSTFGQQSNLTQVRILLVEDNLINQKVLKKQLARHNFVVSTADNGQDAFDFLKTTVHWTGTASMNGSRPVVDVILMDIEMPVMNGWECAQLIRAAQRKGLINKHIPIIAVTANARFEQLNQAIEAGMDEAISKPFHIKDLAAVIARLGIQPSGT